MENESIAGVTITVTAVSFFDIDCSIRCTFFAGLQPAVITIKTTA
jgi:hypothetical protein